MSESSVPAIHHMAVMNLVLTSLQSYVASTTSKRKSLANGPKNLTKPCQPVSRLHHAKARHHRRQTEDQRLAVVDRVGQVVVDNQFAAVEHFKVASRLNLSRLHPHQDWLHRTVVFRHADRHSSVVAAVVVSAGYANARDVSVGTILHWRTASHLHLRRKVNVRHHVVQHHQGQVVMSVAPLDAILISTVKMHETSRFLHRSSQVKHSYPSRSRKTDFGVRVWANGLRLFLRARALIWSSVGLQPTDT